MLKYLFVILIFILTNCSDDEKNILEPNNSSSIIPLDNDNNWSYSFQKFDSNGNVTESGDGQMNIISTTEIEGQTWYKFNEFLYDEVQLFTVIDGSLWSCEKDDYNNTLSLYAKYPTEQNDSYAYTTEYQPATITVLGTQKQIVVPAGTFTCIHYRAAYSGDWSNSVINYYMSPGIGWVKVDNYYENQLTRQWELKSYSIK